MSFETYETSRAQGSPVTLYHFRYGAAANAFYAYTDAENEMVVNGVTYQPIPINRENINASGGLDKSTLTIVTPHTSGLAELFRIYPPSQVVNVIVRQGHYGDPDSEFLVVWTGRVLSCSRDGVEAKFTCEPVSTSLRRAGLRRHYQYGCPHVLYGDGCRADKGTATSEVSVDSVSGTVVILGDGWHGAIAAEKYIGGMVEWEMPNGNREFRTILRLSSTNGVIVAGLPTGIESASEVFVVLGCNHQQDDCLNLHDNIKNYGGQPWIPTKNPIGTVNNFY